MAIGLTFNLPNFTGALFEIGRKNAKFLASIGGLNGGVDPLSNVIFEISRYNLGADDTNGTNLEGQAAPAPVHVARDNAFNVLEIFHEKVEISYTKQGATGQLAATAVPGVNNVQNEVAWQIERTLEKIARKVNYAFLNGSFAFPGDNSAARKTRGLLSAITTNVVDALDTTPKPLSKAHLETLVKKMFDAGALGAEIPVIICNSAQKIALDTIYGKAPDSFTVGGVKLEKYLTPLTELGVMLDMHMPQDKLVITNLSLCKPKGLVIPGKGILFEEPLAKTGASDATQIYGELGLDYGPEFMHGKIINLA